MASQGIVEQEDMMADDRPAIWLVAGVRTPFVGVDGPFAHYGNLAREVWLESKLDPRVPTFTTIMSMQH